MVNFPSDFVRPSSRGLSGVLASALCAIGAERTDGGSFAEFAGDLQLPAARQACVVLIDGLGSQQIAERSGHLPFLRRREGEPITSVAPSTTAAAITSFGTGAAPGETGMLGYTVRRPNGELTNLIRWEHGPAAMRAWQQVPTLAERLAKPDRMVVPAPARFLGSGLTVAAFDGARQLAAESLSDRVDAAVAELRQKRADLAYVYWGEVDHVGHDHGWESSEWGDEAGRTDAELARLARELPKGTLLVITSDHGMVDVAGRIDAATTPELVADVDLVAGEPRASQLFTAKPEEVARRWADYLGQSAWVALRDEALELFGPVNGRFRGVIGDVVVFMRGNGAVVDSRTQTQASINLIGMHGSLTQAEMQIPLLFEVC